MFGKIFSIVMIPIALLIILEQTGIYTLNLPIDKVMVGAVIMILFQIIHLVSIKSHNGEIRPMNYMMSLFFIAPAVLYFIPISIPNLEMVVGVMMLLEGLYTLH